MHLDNIIFVQLNFVQSILCFRPLVVLFSDTAFSKMADEHKSASHDSQVKNDVAPHQIDLLQIHPKNLVENGDCLEHIFMYLDIKSLLNVGQSSEFFQKCAASVFKRKFGSRKISLCLCGTTGHGPSECGDSVHNCDMNKTFQLLRVFGAEISKLEVNFKIPVKTDGSIKPNVLRVNDYINTYCADTVSSLTLDRKPKLPNDYVKPFKNVEQIIMQSTDVKEQLVNFVDCFPKLQRLDTSAENLDANVSLPSLKHLNIYIKAYADEAVMNQLDNLGEFVKANPQLESIKITGFIFKGEYAAGGLLNLFSAHSQLTKFEISGGYRQWIGNIEEHEVNRFMNEHPQLVSLIIHGSFQLKANAAITLARQHKSLNEIRLTFKDSAEHDQFVGQLGNDWIYTSAKEYPGHQIVSLRRK